MANTHTTGKYRPKRSDTRAHAKKRREYNAKIAEKQKIQDIRVTRVQKKDRKERDLPKTGQELVTLSKDERDLRNLKKKLISLESLLERSKNNDKTLTKDQKKKIKEFPKVFEAFQDLLAKATKGGKKDIKLKDDDNEEEYEDDEDDEEGNEEYDEDEMEEEDEEEEDEEEEEEED